MPRQSRGARLWLRPARRSGGRSESAVWIIRDGRRQHSTGCGEGQRAEAEKLLAAYIESKYAPERRERRIGETNEPRDSQIPNLHSRQLVKRDAQLSDSKKCFALWNKRLRSQSKPTGCAAKFFRCGRIYVRQIALSH